jgi:hypothetical protein
VALTMPQRWGLGELVPPDTEPSAHRLSWRNRKLAFTSREVYVEMLAPGTS